MPDDDCIDQNKLTNWAALSSDSGATSSYSLEMLLFEYKEGYGPFALHGLVAASDALPAWEGGAPEPPQAPPENPWIVPRVCLRTPTSILFVRGA